MPAKYTLTIALPCAPPAWWGRLLAPPREIASVQEGRAHALRNADTFRGALEPGETCFIAWIVKATGTVVRTMDFDRAEGSPPVEHGRDTLREMRAVRPA
jgi:hypothetical protein